MEADGESAPKRAKDFLFGTILALATLTLWPILHERSYGTAEQRARALVFVPLVGFAFGVLLAAVDRALGTILSLGARSFAVMLLEVAATLGLGLRGFADTAQALRLGERPAPTGISQMTPFGVLAAIAVFVLQVWCVARIADPPGRTGALVMAAMLSRWSIVPTGYGLKHLEPGGLGVPYEGAITFREFAGSSVVALGLTMGLYQNVGLAVIVVLAILMLGMRLLFSRRLGGAAGFALAGASSIAELVTLATLAALKI